MISSSRARNVSILNSTVLVLVALLVWGCGKSSNTTGAGNSISQVGAATAPNSAALQGLWRGACLADGANRSTEMLFEFAGNAIHFTQRYYRNSSDCGSGDVDERRVLAASRLGVALSFPVGGSTVEANSIEFYRITASGTVAAEFNASNFCGITNWVSGETREVRPVDCGLETFAPFHGGARVVTYQIDGQLYFKSSFNGVDDTFGPFSR